MLTLTFVFVGVICAFQVAVLYFAWRHRRDPLLSFSKSQRSQVLIHLVRAMNNLEAVRIFADALLSKSYGDLNISQTEFVHQVTEKNTKATQEIKDLLDPSQPMSVVEKDSEVPKPPLAQPGTFLDHLQKHSHPSS